MKKFEIWFCHLISLLLSEGRHLFSFPAIILFFSLPRSIFWIRDRFAWRSFVTVANHVLKIAHVILRHLRFLLEDSGTAKFSLRIISAVHQQLLFVFSPFVLHASVEVYNPSLSHHTKLIQLCYRHTNLHLHITAFTTHLRLYF